MQHSIPCRRAALALLAALALATAATPVLAAHGSASKSAAPRHFCPPAC